MADKLLLSSVHHSSIKTAGLWGLLLLSLPRHGAHPRREQHLIQQIPHLLIRALPKTQRCPSSFPPLLLDHRSSFEMEVVLLLQRIPWV